MHEHSERSNQNQGNAIANNLLQNKEAGESQEGDLQLMANNSSQVQQFKYYQQMADNRKPSSTQPPSVSAPPIQRFSHEEEHPVQGRFVPAQRKVNDTGLPGQLKSGVEQLSRFSMDDVKVHYNSDRPAQFKALAYAQGTDIHVAPGQEKHLPHEAWHVVQQKQGRVAPTLQMKNGEAVNDDVALEKEADDRGARPC